MALVLEFLHEPTKGEVRDLFFPQAFHTRKVQVFKEQNIKLTTKFYRQFPVVICSLIRRFLVDTRNRFAFALLVARTFHLTRIRFLCVCQLLGIEFVEHWRGLSVSVTTSQEILDTKVKPFRFTGLGFVSDFPKIFSECDIHISECVPMNLNAFDFAFYRAVQRKTIPMSIETDFIRLWVLHFLKRG